MIPIAPGIALEDDEIEFVFLRASGPGGQHVNKAATAVQLRFNLARCKSLPAAVRERLRRLAGRRVSREGVLVIGAQRFRSREANRRDAIERLVQWLRAAAREPKTRKAMRPPRAAHERRLEAKRRRSELKRSRRIRPDFT
jgi:ribosome-associated protein